MEEHKEHEGHGQHGEPGAASGGFKPKKIRHKMYGSKTATTEAEYTASKDEGWEDDDDQPGQKQQQSPPKR